MTIPHRSPASSHRRRYGRPALDRSCQRRGLVAGVLQSCCGVAASTPLMRLRSTNANRGSPPWLNKKANRGLFLLHCSVEDNHVGLFPNIPRRHFGGPDPHRGLLCRMVFYGMAEVASRTMNLSACCHRSNAEPISRECRWRLQMPPLCMPQCVRLADITDGPRAHDSPTALRQSRRLQRSCSRC
jgi:hypothetical protein